jgi:hypothetical protein
VIVRRTPDQLLLITQPDHAALAGAIVSAWRADGLPASPRRDVVLFATTHHDDGWLELDVAPLVGADGQLLDFINSPDDVRLAVWPRAVKKFAGNPYVAALVAQHALSIYEPYRGHAVRAAFFAEMQMLRDESLARAAPRTAADLAADYFFVGLGDTLSLTFCNGWTESRRVGGYEIRLVGNRLTVDPDPFEGRDLAFRISARQLPHRRFTADEAASAYQSAPLVTLDAVLSGPSGTSLSRVSQ